MSKDGYVAVMQPYVFPYIGYFHLIDASSVFVFYDDVQYIKGGWVNRNNVIQNRVSTLFSVPVSKVSSNRLINETPVAITDNWKNKFYKQLIQNYSKAPYFDVTMDVIKQVIEGEYNNISELAITSITTVLEYVGLPFEYRISSNDFGDTKGLDRVERLVYMTKQLGYSAYANAPGGKELYTKDDFLKHEIELAFVESQPVEYEQFSDEFIPWLSIIDLLMFNDRKQTLDLFKTYTLV